MNLRKSTVNKNYLHLCSRVELHVLCLSGLFPTRGRLRPHNLDQCTYRRIQTTLPSPGHSSALTWARSENILSLHSTWTLASAARVHSVLRQERSLKLVSSHPFLWSQHLVPFLEGEGHKLLRLQKTTAWRLSQKPAKSGSRGVGWSEILRCCGRLSVIVHGGDHLVYSLVSEVPGRLSQRELLWTSGPWVCVVCPEHWVICIVITNRVGTGDSH